MDGCIDERMEGRMETTHLFHVIVSGAHPFGVNHVRSREHCSDKLLQVLRAQTSFLGEDVALGDRLDHADNKDVPDVFQKSRRTRLGITQIDDCSANPKLKTSLARKIYRYRHCLSYTPTR